LNNAETIAESVMQNPRAASDRRASGGPDESDLRNRTLLAQSNDLSDGGLGIVASRLVGE
jgi:hypothetical protein